jgi:hypothetical protein
MNEPVTRNPFKRAKALYMHILGLRASMQDSLPELAQALGGVPEYRSRGHGGKYRVMARQNYRSTNKFMPHQGERECARRRGW